MGKEEGFEQEQEHDPWVTVDQDHNRRRRTVALAGCLLVVASLTALILGLTLYGTGGHPMSVNSATGPGESQAPVASPPPSTPQPTSQTLFMFLQQRSLYDGSELEDNTSYQYKAYVWLESTSYAQLPEWRILQRFTLACIYYATFQVRTLFTDTLYGNNVDIPPWNNTENWLSSNNECTWFGILCNDHQRVREVELYSNSLTGSFPPEVVHFKNSLIALDLYDNAIWNEGDQGNAWLQNLTNLGKNGHINLWMRTLCALFHLATHRLSPPYVIKNTCFTGRPFFNTMEFPLISERSPIWWSTIAAPLFILVSYGEKSLAISHNSSIWQWVTIPTTWPQSPRRL
jgi:hypothetical protein